MRCFEKQSDHSFMPEIVEAAKRVNEAELKWATVAKYSPIAMCIVSNEGYFLDVNPAACILFEQEYADLVGTKWQDYTHPNDLVEDEHNIAETIKDADIHYYQMLKRYCMPDGREKKCLLKVATVSDNDDVFCYFISLIVDLDQMRTFLEMAKKVFNTRDECAS